MFNKVEKQYLQSLQRLAMTTDGKLVLTYLREKYIISSSLKTNSHDTYYSLGQKELIQSVLNDCKQLDLDRDLDILMKEVDKTEEVEVRT